jgi:hypothetical protein
LSDDDQVFAKVTKNLTIQKKLCNWPFKKVFVVSFLAHDVLNLSLMVGLCQTQNKGII